MKRRGFLKGLLAGGAVAGASVVIPKQTSAEIEKPETVKARKISKRRLIVIDENALPEYHWDTDDPEYLYKKEKI